MVLQPVRVAAARMTRASMVSVVVFMAWDVVDCFIRSSYPTPLDRFPLVEALRDCLKPGESRVGGDFSVGQEGGVRQYPCGLVASDPTLAKGKSQPTLWARAREAVWLRSLLGQSPLRGFSLAGA